MSEQAEQTAERPHIIVARRQWEMEKQASEQKKVRIVNGRIVTYTPDPPPYDLETTLLMAHAAEEKIRQQEFEAALNGDGKAMNAVLNSNDASILLGRMIKGRGIYFGTWAPKDREGKSLGKIFNLFAAPQDLGYSTGSTYKFNEVAERTAQVKNLYGHDGGNFRNDTELYDALKTNSYKGEWFIPTLDILGGIDEDKNELQVDNLYKYKDTGEFKDTFRDASAPTLSQWYWSLTDETKKPARIWNGRFASGKFEPNDKGLLRLSTRLVRAELRS